MLGSMQVEAVAVQCSGSGGPARWVVRCRRSRSNCHTFPPVSFNSLCADRCCLCCFPPSHCHQPTRHSGQAVAAWQVELGTSTCLTLPPSTLSLPGLVGCVSMQSAVALLAARVASGEAALYANYDAVNADKRLLLQRTVSTIAALDGSSGSDQQQNRSVRRRRWHRHTDHLLPLLTLLPPTHTLPPQKEDAVMATTDGAAGEDGAEEAEVGTLEVLTVEALYQSGLADSGCCDGRWLISALVRSRPPHTSQPVTLLATTADRRVDMACYSSGIDSLPPSSIVCLRCEVDLLSSTPADLLHLRTLLTIQHTHSHDAAGTLWTRCVLLPRFPHPSQRVALFESSESLDTSFALSLSPLSSAVHHLSLRLDGCLPLDALSTLIQQRLHLQPIDHTRHHTSVYGVGVGHLTASDELLASSSYTQCDRSAHFLGLCCLLSAPPTAASSICSMQMYSVSESATLSFLYCLRAALPSSCRVSVDVAAQPALQLIQRAVAAMTAETQEAVSSHPITALHRLRATVSCCSLRSSVAVTAALRDGVLAAEV